MDNLLKVQLNHRTIRAWKDEPISKEDFDKLMEVANRTATSNGMQQSSIIRVNDKEKRKALSEIANQSYINDAPELLIFIVDNYRNSKIMEEKGCKEHFANDGDRFFQGFTDGVLMSQNIVVAAEAMGLGTVYFGSILNDALKVSEILNLPENTFPIVGLGIGYPDQEPQLKPRMPIDLKVFEDEYEIFDSYLEELKDYDAKMTEYYDLRNANQRVDTFTNQVFDKNKSQLANRSKLFDYIKEKGFNI